MTTSSGVARRRLGRDEKKALTRRQLLDAAARVFLRRGFFAASLDEVAEEAGFSKGAVYSNFADKDDLLVALMEERVEARTNRVTQLVGAEVSQEARARLAGQEFTRILEEERAWAPLILEFWACVARNGDLQRRFASSYRAMKAALARLVEEQAALEHQHLSMPAADLVTAGFAMGNGVSVERVADPEGVSDELFGAMLTSFFSEVVR